MTSDISPQDIDLTLNAYLDGELDEAEMQALEARLEHDPALRAELDALAQADHSARAEFDAMLDQPVPDHLIAAIETATIPVPANRTTPVSGWMRLAAALALLVLGAGLGFGLAQRPGAAPQVAQLQRGWLDDIADYHAVYAGQKRHLVEVPATEAAHIETWLTGTVGVAFQTPDLDGLGLTYQGARLLVAAGKPVGQLIYTDATGAVYAFCMIASTKGASAGTSTRSANGFDMVSWTSDSAGYVVVGPQGAPALADMATQVSAQI